MTTPEELLAILNSHCQSSLGCDAAGPSSLRPALAGPSIPDCSDEEEYDDEWGGIIHGGSDTEDAESEADFDETNDDNFVADSSMFTTSNAHTPNVTVYIDPSTSTKVPKTTSKAEMKAFMSSKISKLRQDDSSSKEKRSPGDKDSDDDDRTNIENDALLHRLVHTKLLSGSLNPELDLTPAQKRKALAGRVLELSGSAKLGKGEEIVRTAERNKASKRVREGLGEKIEERKKARLEEAKNLGNYHPTLKKLYDTSSSTRSTNKKRERGLGMGVGKFKGGILTIGKSDLAKIQQKPGGRKGSRGPKSRR